MNFVILCPYLAKTGGPEALHQLGNAFSELGVKSQIWYTLNEDKEILKDIKSEDYEALENRLVQILKDVYEQKMSKVGDKQKSEIERILYLQILDNAYREHLYAMDTLKTGIGLRGYNQKDPLVEYKKESYNMFIELIANIKNEIIKILYTIQLQSNEDRQKEQEAIARMKEQLEEATEHITTNVAQEAVRNSDKKIARNETCPCGSGKKYKKCCYNY